MPQTLDSVFKVWPNWVEAFKISWLLRIMGRSIPGWGKAKIRPWAAHSGVYSNSEFYVLLWVAGLACHVHSLRSYMRCVFFETATGPPRLAQRHLVILDTWLQFVLECTPGVGATVTVVAECMPHGVVIASIFGPWATATKVPTSWMD